MGLDAAFLLTVVFWDLFFLQLLELLYLQLQLFCLVAKCYEHLNGQAKKLQLEVKKLPPTL